MERDRSQPGLLEHRKGEKQKATLQRQCLRTSPHDCPIQFQLPNPISIHVAVPSLSLPQHEEEEEADT